MVSSDLNCVNMNVPRCSEQIFHCFQRVTKKGKFVIHPYTPLPSTIPILKKRQSKRLKLNVIPMANLDNDCRIIRGNEWKEVKRSSDRCRKRKLTSAEKEADRTVDFPVLHEMTVDPWVEDFSRPVNSHKRRVTLPPYFDKICSLFRKTTHIFSWSITGSCVDRYFWLTLLGCSNNRWLSDKPDADWAIVGPYLCPLVMGKDVSFLPANGVKYPVSWTEIDWVFIPLNQPKKYYCLAVLHIMTRVITLYDSLGVPQTENRKWWKKMRLTFENVIPTYLDECGVLKAKCISLETYKIKFEVAQNVPT